jgi:hypothetical protein
MTDPITALTVSTIASLAFQEFVKSGAGELAKKFTGEAIAKMGQLRELILNRLTGKHSAIDEAIEKAKAGEKEGIENVAAFLNSELLIDKEFAGQVQAIAQEINAGKLLDQISMVQNNYDSATGYQIKNDGGENFIANNITINKT